MVDTGYSTNTAGRLLHIKDLLGDNPFFLTYGDGLCNVDLGQLLAFHKKQEKDYACSETNG